MKNRVLITGATGFIGSHFVNGLKSQFEIIIVSRSPKKAERKYGANFSYASWDKEDLLRVLELSDFVIHLAGESLASRFWTKSNKKKLYESRIKTGMLLSEVICSYNIQLSAFVQASAIGFYGDRGDELLDERSSSGTGFLAELVQDWEASTNQIEKAGIRRICLRLGLVISPNGGLIKKIKIPFLLFLGGHFGKGNNWFSYISIECLLLLVTKCLKENRFEGIINAVNGEPKRSRDFFRDYGHSINRPSWLHIPSFLLKLLPGNMGEEFLLSSARVVSIKNKKRY